MDILETIIGHKKSEVAERKAALPVAGLAKSAFFNRPVLSMSGFLKDPSKTGIIAEFKRKSPSKGVINGTASVATVTAAYAKGGASGCRY